MRYTTHSTVPAVQTASETSLHSPFAHAYFGHVRELIVAGQIEDHSRRTYIAGSVCSSSPYLYALCRCILLTSLKINHQLVGQLGSEMP